MRHFNLLILVISFMSGVFFSSCNQAGKTGNTTKGSTEETADTVKNLVKPAKDSAATKIPEPANSIAPNLEFLKEMDGKYPFDVKLLDQPEIKQRLSNMLGTRFYFLKSTWAVENPIEISNNIFIATGCETHNCGSTNFIIAVDLIKNIMYAGVRENDKVKTYSENGSNIQQVNDWAAGK